LKGRVGEGLETMDNQKAKQLRKNLRNKESFAPPPTPPPEEGRKAGWKLLWYNLFVGGK
jgi:hypothetical protein